MEPGRPFRYVLAGWAILETMLFGGIINGWASLVFVLKEDGLYSHLCTSASSPHPAHNATDAAGLQQTEEQQMSCNAQDGKLNLWFTIAAALRNIYGIVIGFHIFKFGTRSARLAGWLMFSIGALMMAFADEQNPWLVLPSLMTLSYGGVTLLLTNVQISCLFPRAAGVIVTLVSGAFDFSAATQLAVKMLHESGLVSRLYSYVGLAGLQGIMVLISTLCFLPKDTLTPQADTTSPRPQQPPHPRKRRDSLYDWSEINVHTNHHGLKCGACEDGSTDGEQREQLATNHTLGCDMGSQHGLPQEDLNGDQCIPLDITMPDSDLLNRVDCIMQPESSQVNEPEFSHAKRLVTTNCSQIHSSPSCLHAVEPSSTPIFTISEAVGHEQQSSIQMVKLGGKFLSIIDVGFPRNKISTREANDSLQQERGETKIVPAPKDEPAMNGSLMKVHANGRRHHKVTLDLAFEDNWSEKAVSNRPESYKEDAGEDTENTVKESNEEEQELFPTLKSCLQSTVFWLHVLWFAFNVLRLVAFFGFINTKLTAMFNGDKDKVSYFTNVQAYFILAIMAVCWTSGAVYDWQTSIFKGRRKGFEQLVLPGALPLAMTSLLGVAISVAWIVDSETTLYVMFALLVFYNAFIFGICLSFTLRVFPERYFGILNGVLSIIGGAFCFLQYAIFVWYDSYADGPLHANIFMLALTVLSLIHPLYIVCKSMALNSSAP